MEEDAKSIKDTLGMLWKEAGEEQLNGLFPIYRNRLIEYNGNYIRFFYRLLSLI